MKKNENIYPYADLVLYNGKMWTASNKDSKDKSAVAIKENIIIYVGDDKKVKRYIAPHTKVIDLQEKRVVPGFEDSHAHLLMMPARILGNLRKYEPQLTEDAGSILLRLLIFLYGQIIHRLCKFLGKTPMDIDEFPMLPKFLIKRSWRKMMDEIVKMGVTSVTEAGLKTWKEFEILQEMYNDGELKVRFNILLASRLLDSAIERGYRTGYGDEWIRITGIKLYSDGWITPRTAALREPYDNVPGRGILFYEKNRAEELVRKAWGAGLRVATHAIGDRATKTMLEAYKKVLTENDNSNDEKKDLDHRFTIEHATLLSEDETLKNDLSQLMKNLNVTASIQLSFSATDCENISKALGEDRIKYWNIWKTLHDEGIRCAGGSDYPIATVSPLWGIQHIVTRKGVDGDPEGCNPEEKLPIEDALRLITIDAAYNSFEENIKGSIEVGKIADLVVLSDDIIAWGHDEEKVGEIYKIKVEMTIIDGKIVYVHPKSSLYPLSKTNPPIA